MEKAWLCLVLVLIMLLCSCGASNPETKDSSEESTIPPTTEMTSISERTSSSESEPVSLTEPDTGMCFKGYYLKAEKGSEIVHLIFVVEGNEYLKAGDWAVIRPFSSREKWNSGDGIVIYSSKIEDSDPPGVVPASIEQIELADSTYSFRKARGAVEEDGYCVKDRSSEPSASADRLQLYDIQKLVTEKGEKLTWEDFEKYQYEEIGSGMYIRKYPVGSENEHILLIKGKDLSKEPEGIRLYLLGDGVLDIETDKNIDIRYDDLEQFLALI